MPGLLRVIARSLSCGNSGHQLVPLINRYKEETRVAIYRPLGASFLPSSVARHYRAFPYMQTIVRPAPSYQESFNASSFVRSHAELLAQLNKSSFQPRESPNQVADPLVEARKAAHHLANSTNVSSNVLMPSCYVTISTLWLQSKKGDRSTPLAIPAESAHKPALSFLASVCSLNR